jgi:hypothetical protein
MYFDFVAPDFDFVAPGLDFVVWGLGIVVRDLGIVVPAWKWRVPRKGGCAPHFSST